MNSAQSETLSFSRDLLFYLPAKIIPAGLSFLLIIALARSLPAAEYGAYATILAIAGLSDALAFVWLRQAILRFYPDYHIQNKARNFQGNVLSLAIVVSVLESLLAAGIMSLLGYDLEQVALMLSVLLALTPFNYLITLLQSRRFSRNYAIATIVQSSVQALWILTFVYWAQKGYYYAVFAVSAGYVGGVFFILANKAKTDIHLHLTIRQMDWKLIRSLLVYGIPMSIWMVCFQVLYQVDRLIIGALRSQSEVGIYASAYDLINGSISLMMTPFLLAAHPIIMQLWAQTHDRTAIEELIKRVFRYLLLLSIPVFFLSFAISKNLLSVLLGQDYGVEGWVVSVLVAGAFFGGFSMYVHKGLEISNRTAIMLLVAILTASLNIGLNLLFVGRYGYPASAVITVISYVFYMIVVYSFSRHYIRILMPWGTILRIGASVGLAGTVVWLVEHYVTANIDSFVLATVLNVLLFSTIYMVTLWVTGEFTSEVRWLLILIKRRRQDQTMTSEAL